jgi:hypothetical protein
MASWLTSMNLIAHFHFFFRDLESQVSYFHIPYTPPIHLRDLRDVLLTQLCRVALTFTMFI